MKKRLKLLTDSEQKREHLDNIRCVTDNGVKLMGDIPMSSQDVLERVSVLLSDDDYNE